MTPPRPLDRRPSAVSRIATAFALTLTSLAASAGVTLEFGDPANPLTPVSNLDFLPGETRSVQLLIYNDSAVDARLSGYTLEIGIANGGPPLGGTLGPAFTAADLVTGTLFESDHSTPTVLGGPNPLPPQGSVPQYLGLSLNTISSAEPGEAVGAVTLPPGRSLLGTLTISAAGFTTAQSWPMTFVDAGVSTFLNDADNNQITPDIANATLTVVPEPAHALAAVGVALAAFTVIRRLRAGRKG